MTAAKSSRRLLIPGELQSWFLAEHLVDTPLVRLAHGKHGNSN